MRPAAGKGRVRSLDDKNRRYVFVDAARCPTCSSASLRTYKTVPDKDGGDTVYRYKRCQDCGDEFIVVTE